MDERTSAKTITRGKFRKKYYRFLPLYLMMIPGLLYLLINNYVPMSGVIIAFKRVNFGLGILKSPWVGFDNFKFLFKTSDAFVITRNTICYNVAFIVIGTLVSITVAILLDKLTNKFTKNLYQTIILVPFMISIVVVSYLVYALLSTDSGFINNSILAKLGMENISWYSNPKYWPIILVLVNTWKGFGYSTIIYFATIVGFDSSYYEAAAIDGATKWQQVKCITLPCLKSTIIMLTLLSIGKIFYSDFGLFYQVPMNSGPLFDVTNTIDTYVYRGLMQLNNIGMSSAAGLYQSFVGFLLVLAANFAVSKISKEDVLF